MANCLEIQLADAIVAVINAATWPETFRAERTYADIDHTLEELDVLKVEVALPEGWDDSQLNDRNSDTATVVLEVSIRKRFGLERQNQTDDTIQCGEIDRLVNLTIEIARKFSTDQVTGIECNWRGMNLPQIYDRVKLREFHQFTSFIELEYEINRTLPT